MQEANTLDKFNSQLMHLANIKNFFLAINHKKFTSLVNYLNVAFLKQFFCEERNGYFTKTFELALHMKKT